MDRVKKKWIDSGKECIDFDEDMSKFSVIVMIVAVSRLLSKFTPLLHGLFPYPCDLCGRILVGKDRMRVCIACYQFFCTLAAEKKKSVGSISMTVYQHCFFYEEHTPVQKLLLSAKFGRHPRYVDVLCDMVIEVFRPYLSQFDVYIPVPSHPHSLNKRRFCLVYSVTQLLAAILGKHFCPDVRIHPDQTVEQKTLSRFDRINNVAGKFFLQNHPTIAKFTSPMNILVLDDVVTTGSTLHAVHTLLKTCPLAHHFTQIGAFFFARTR